MLKIIGAVLGIIAGLFVAYMSPPAGLTVKSMLGLGVFIWAVVWLIFDVFPDYIVCLGMCGLWVLVGAVKFNVAFSFFSNPNWWILVGAFGLGLAASKTGLLRRISLLIMKLFPSTFKGQTIAMLGAGTVISPLIPSFTAKAAICAPLARGISDAMGYPVKSRGASGLFAANVIGFIAMAPAFLSASYLGFMLVSLVPKELQGRSIGWVVFIFFAVEYFAFGSQFYLYSLFLQAQGAGYAAGGLCGGAVGEDGSHGG
jgi:DASS family divalent anion:Na+ symporter